MEQQYGAVGNVECMNFGQSPVLFSSSVDKLLRALRLAPFVFLSLEWKVQVRSQAEHLLLLSSKRKPGTVRARSRCRMGGCEQVSA
jgi:hypothetical protein